MIEEGRETKNHGDGKGSEAFPRKPDTKTTEEEEEE